MQGRLGKLVVWVAVAAAVVAFVAFVGSRAAETLGPGAGQLELGRLTLSAAIFWLLAAMAVGGAAGVALSRDILYSALGLLASLLGAGSLYVFLSADFIAVTQLLVYIGGVLVLILFAVMLTNQIGQVNVSNASFGVAGGLLLFLATAPLLLVVAVGTPWKIRPDPALAETTARIGNAFLQQWLLPFELASLILLATLIGAVVMARKELKADEA
ncbi:MAG TPA: NADH-quinone oxidoreductase subunit J [Anaeromyxobacteraceae bacterium]|nr:NADH-quinone oxidoreductase subunit J [Anaeromyxobacteraceae bacterium]